MAGRGRAGLESSGSLPVSDDTPRADPRRPAQPRGPPAASSSLQQRPCNQQSLALTGDCPALQASPNHRASQSPRAHWRPLSQAPPPPPSAFIVRLLSLWSPIRSCNKRECPSLRLWQLAASAALQLCAGVIGGSGRAGRGGTRTAEVFQKDVLAVSSSRKELLRLQCPHPHRLTVPTLVSGPGRQPDRPPPRPRPAPPQPGPAWGVLQRGEWRAARICSCRQCSAGSAVQCSAVQAVQCRLCSAGSRPALCHQLSPGPSCRPALSCWPGACRGLRLESG